MEGGRNDEDIFHVDHLLYDQANHHLDPSADNRTLQDVQCDLVNSNHYLLTPTNLPSESASQYVRLNSQATVEDADPQINHVQDQLTLKLCKTPSLVDFIQKFPRPLNVAGNLNSSRPTSSEKFKAENFPAKSLKTGSYMKNARHEADLVAKIYYAKRKLVWEILDDKLKNKLEMQWSDILSLRATIVENSPGILEIELDQPPAFFRERDPQPRKHTNWKASSDFTGMEASLHRRHYLVFHPGVIDKHYEKLLRYDERLLQLSQGIYPSLKNPYFDISAPASIFYGMDGGGGIINPILPPQIADLPMLPYQQIQYANPNLTSSISGAAGYIQDHNLVSPAGEGMAMRPLEGHGFGKKTSNDIVHADETCSSYVAQFPAVGAESHLPDTVYADGTLHHSSSYVAQFLAGGAENHLPDTVYPDGTLHHNSSYVAQFLAGVAENHLLVNGSYLGNTNGSHSIAHADSSSLLLSATQEYNPSSTTTYDGQRMVHGEYVMPCAPPSCWAPPSQEFLKEELVTTAVDDDLRNTVVYDEPPSCCGAFLAGVSK